MRLIDLEAAFLRHEQRPPDEESRRLNPQWPTDYMCDWFIPVDDMKQAHGIQFLCPKSVAAGHQHFVMVWFVGSPVPPHIGHNKDGDTVRWNVSGNGLLDLSLTPSILEEDSLCGWHGFVTNGEAK